MEILRELVIFATSNKNFDELPHLQLGINAKGKKLISLIENDEIHKDDTASQQIFDRSPDSTYRTFKGRLKDSLINICLLWKPQQSKLSQISAADYKCSKRLALSKYFQSTGKLSIAAGLMKTRNGVLAVAKEYHLTTAIVDALSLIRDSEALKGNEKEVQNLNKEILFYAQQLGHEIQARSDYMTIASACIKSETVNADLESFCSTKIAEMKQLVERYESFQLRKYWMLTRQLQAQMRTNYLELEQVCEEQIQWYESNVRFRSKSLVSDVQLLLSTACYGLRKTNIGLNYIQSALDGLNHGGGNWISAMEIKFLLCTQNRQFEEAARVQQLVFALFQFDTNNIALCQKWHLYRSAIVEVFRHPSYSGKKLIPMGLSFDSEDIRRETSIYRKDKDGLYPAILTIEFLNSMHNCALLNRHSSSHYDKILNMADSYKLYLSSRMGEGNNFRANCLLTAIVEVAEAEFDVNKSRLILRNAKSKLAKVEGTPRAWIKGAEPIPVDYALKMIENLVELFQEREIIVPKYGQVV